MSLNSSNVSIDSQGYTHSHKKELTEYPGLLYIMTQFIITHTHFEHTHTHTERKRNVPLPKEMSAFFC